MTVFAGARGRLNRLQARDQKLGGIAAATITNPYNPKEGKSQFIPWRFLPRRKFFLHANHRPRPSRIIRRDECNNT